MIAGLGLDIVEIHRIQKAMKRHGERLLEKVLTRAEQEFCQHDVERIAARFAAKEAVLKALGTGWSGGIRWTDVEVVRDRRGRVGVKLDGAAARVAKKLR